MSKAPATLYIDCDQQQVNLDELLSAHNERQCVITVAARAVVTMVTMQPCISNCSIVLQLEPGAMVQWLWHQHVLPGNALKRVISIVAGQGASCTLHLLSTVFSGQLQDNLNVMVEDSQACVDIRVARMLAGNAQATLRAHHEHSASYTISAVRVRDVVQDFAQSFFNGYVVIAEGATGSDGLQDHKALLLSETARCQAAPEIQVCTDQISCAHGSAIGKLSHEHLRYLQARGLVPDYARQLLLQAFVVNLMPAGASSIVLDAYHNYMRESLYE